MSLNAESDRFVATVPSGRIILHPVQYFRGWCVLWAVPEMARLEDLPAPARDRFLSDMGLLGQAVSAVCRPRRLNYAIYGNATPVLHAHVIPRYDWEEPDLRTQAVWNYPPERWRDPASDDPSLPRLRQELADAIGRLSA